MNADLGRGESPEVNTRRVLIIVAGILAFIIIIAFGFELVFRDRIGQTFIVQHPFPAPTLIAAERAQRLALEAPQKRDLQGARGRTPIDLAMKAIAAKGPHAFDPLESQQ
jgi:hypothetical protein